VYCIVRAQVDNGPTQDVEVASPTTKEFVFPDLPITAGRHVLRLSFVNDQSGDGEDRNLTLNAAGFVGASAMP
jgi:hypothetical protein